MIKVSTYRVGNPLANGSQQQVHYRVMVNELLSIESSIHTFRRHIGVEVLTLFLKASILENSVDHLNLAHICLLFELESRISYFFATFSRRFNVSPIPETISFTIRTLSSPACTNVEAGSLASSFKIARELERVEISPTSSWNS